jgi:hypothetical protein
MAYSSTSPSPSVQQRPSTRRRYLAVVAVLLLAGAAVAYWMRSSIGESRKPVPVAVGAVGRDGDLEFIVSGVKCGTRTAGKGAAAITAQGVYCFVDIQVTNRGGTATHVDGAAQKITDGTGTQYLSDTSADRKANDQAWSDPIPPGGVRSGSLIFDVPQGTKPTEIELHESLLSLGVRVTLS